MKKALILLGGILILFAGYRLVFERPAIKNADPLGENIICFGNSLTFGSGAEKGQDYPSQLSRLVKEPIINAGIPGDTTALALARLDKDIIRRSPKIVFITLGGNDLLRGVAKEKAFANLKTIIESIQRSGALVVVGGISYPFLDRGYADKYESVCRETGALYVPDILGGIITNSHLMNDRIHPNAEGYAIMADKFFEAAKKYL